MADCNETIRELDAYLDDELPDHVRAHIHVHLETCVDCLQAFDFHAELKAAIRRKCTSDPMPSDLVDRLQACLNLDSTSKPRLDGDAVDEATT